MSVSVLVLEDDQNMQELIVESLEDSGYFSQGAGSAAEAIELAGKFKFSLVISDVRMAGGTDGLGALAAIKKQQPEMRCIVITGFASQDAPARALDIQVDDYVYKPFRLDELQDAVKRVLASSSERTSYKNLLSSVLSAPKRLLEYAEASRREGAQKNLEQQRDRVFQGFFVGIRSNHLTRGAGLDVWDTLERLENDYHLCTRRGSGPPELNKLASGYDNLFQLMKAMAQSESVGSMARREAWQVDRARFGRFYDRIHSGQVTPEQLRVSFAVWRTPTEARNGNPEFLKLYQLLWE